ncbi:MAG: hypothetical protein O9293_09415 [Porphyrobacter sp.]|nr:hypothetical protein [Porphyrobacter sp.]
MSTNLLRVHDELTKVAQVQASGDYGEQTKIPPSDLDALPACQLREQEQLQA